MIVRRFTFTAVAAILFVFSLYHEGLLLPVSGETSINQIEQISVKQGVTQDGSLSVSMVSDAPPVPPRKKSPNHRRTLRAFIAPNRGGVSTLFIESVLPHEVYGVSGMYRVSQDYPTLFWKDEGTLIFYASSAEGALYEITLDVRSLSLMTKLTEPSNVSRPADDIYDKAVM